MFVYWGALKHFISRYTHCFKLMFCLYWHCQLNLTVFWIWLKFNINGDSYSIFSYISTCVITASHIQLTFPCRTCSGLDSCLFTIQNLFDSVVRTFKPKTCGVWKGNPHSASSTNGWTNGVIWLLFAPGGAFRNCVPGPYFRAKTRGIGYSFQLAITTPRINLIGYGTATAQSYRKSEIVYI